MSGSSNKLNQAMRSCSKSIGAIVFFSMFINLLMFVAPIHMLQIYDRVLMSRSSVTLVVLTGLALGLLLVYGVLEGIRSRLLVRMGLKLDELMSDYLFRATFRTKLKSPNISIQVLNDLDQVRNFIAGGAVIALCDAPWVPIFVGVGFILHPILGFVSLAGAILIFLVAIANEFMTRSKLDTATAAALNANQDATQGLTNCEVVHAHGMVSALQGKWSEQHNKVLTYQTDASDRAGELVAVSRCLRMSLQVIILGAGAYLAILDEITPGVMIAASIIMGRALAPVELAVGQWRPFVSARGAYGRLNKLVDAQPESIEHMDLPPPIGNMNVENVVIVPPGAPDAVIRGVSLVMKPGTITGIVGPSGSGKSTLVRAMVGVWLPVRGVIRIDGASIDQWDPEKLGPYIGYMPQDVELFSGTIAENISRFQGVDSDAIVRAAKRAGVHELILELPNGYDTSIGPGGQALSGGQRQRIALARALYKEPKIVVLDEPNASLDSEGERALIEAIVEAKNGGSTVILISHRPNLLNCADGIAVLKDGSLVKVGPRNQILQDLSAPGSSNPSKSSSIN